MELTLHPTCSQSMILSLVEITLVLLTSELAPWSAVAQSFQYGGNNLTESHVIDDEEDDDSFKKPWQINKGLCPPILCMEMRNRNSAPQSFPFFEGDIVLDAEQKRTMNWSRGRRLRRGTRTSTRKRRAIVRPISRRWPDAIVPYEIDPKLGNRTRYLLSRAFEHFHNHTCIRFRPKTETDTDYVNYVYQPGCWSSVGRTGGRQVISLGEDCVQFGTIVHETAHAIGFWHEQSRPDRDSYVKVIKKNIDSDFLDQFGKRSDNESSSHGFAYDYNSIMHYGTNVFSERGQPTIKLIGIGKKLMFNIGQQKRLSDLDIAQLNDMYHCHRKEADRKNCREGWVKFRSSCYSFFANDSLQFFPASKTCRSRNSHLVSIDDEAEDEFLKDHLKNQFPSVNGWRTGGIRLAPSDVFVWYHPGSGGKHSKLVYEAWTAENENAKEKNSVVLVRVNTTQRVNENITESEIHFEWATGDIGSGRRPQDNKYPIICEAKAKQSNCFDNQQPKGRDFRGHLTYTRDAITCQRWTRRYPHNHTISPDRDEGIGDHNFCRNPNGLRRRPWCYTLLKNVVWQYCDVTLCNNNNRK